MTTTKEALAPCPFCGVEGVPDPINEGWFAIRHTEVCYFTQNGRDITAHHVPMHQNWNSRVSAPSVAPVVDDGVVLVDREVAAKRAFDAVEAMDAHGYSLLQAAANAAASIRNLRPARADNAAGTLTSSEVEELAEILQSSSPVFRARILSVARTAAAPASTVAPQQSEQSLKKLAGRIIDAVVKSPCVVEVRFFSQPEEAVKLENQIAEMLTPLTAPAFPAAVEDEAETGDQE